MSDLNELFGEEEEKQVGSKGGAATGSDNPFETLQVDFFETKLFDGTKVRYRPFLVKEQKSLMISQETGDQAAQLMAMGMLIEKCVVEPKLNYKELPMYDIDWLFLKIRTKSVGDTSTVKMKCKKCEKNAEVILDLDKAEIHVADDFKSEFIIDERTQIGVEMRTPKITDIQKYNLKEFENNINDKIDLIENCIVAVYSPTTKMKTEDVSKATVTNFINNLGIKQFEKISSYFDKGPKTVIDDKFTCPFCKTVNGVHLEGTANFFELDSDTIT